MTTMSQKVRTTSKVAKGKVTNMPKTKLKIVKKHSKVKKSKGYNAKAYGKMHSKVFGLAKSEDSGKR